jgi:hypothetical protein
MQGHGGSILARDAGTAAQQLTPAAQHIATRRMMGLPELRCTFDATCPGCSQQLTSQAEAVLHYPCCPGPAQLAPAGSHAGDVYATQMTHTALKKAVGRIITEAGHCVIEEVPGLFEDSADRPGDCTVLGFHDGQCHLAIDVNCTRLLTNSNLTMASNHPGKVLDTIELDKRARYAMQLQRAGGRVAFVPFVTDEYGSIGDHGHKLLEVLAQRATQRGAATEEGGMPSSTRKSLLLTRWRSYIAVAIHRVQAEVILMMTARAGKDATRIIVGDTMF